MTTRLARQDWIDEALRSLMHAGIDAVRVEPLARALKVTKGSFYWHFKDRPALLAAMLEAWQARATGAVTDQVEAAGGDAAARMMALWHIVMQADGRLENAMRGWAAHDPAAADVVGAVDRRRVGYVAALFAELGFSPEAATARARFSYLALIGRYTLGRGDADALRRDVDVILPMLMRREG